MDAIIDTNLFFYLSGLSTTKDFNPDEIRLQLKTYKNVYMSDLSIIEFITHFKNDKEMVMKGRNYIASEHILVIPVFPKEQNTLLKRVHEFILNGWDKYIKDILEFKIEVEASFLIAWLASIVAIFSEVLILSKPLNDDTKLNLFKIQNLAHIKSILEDKTVKYKQFHMFLEDFYKSNDDTKLRDNIVELILINLYPTMVFYKSAEYNKIFTQLTESSDKIELKHILDDLQNDSFTKKIFNRMGMNKELMNLNVMNNEFEKASSVYESELTKKIKPALIKYNIILFRKFFRIKDKKIKKNDIFDSLFLVYYPEHQILTCDSKFFKIIKEIDPKYAKNISDFIDKCKLHKKTHTRP